MRSLRRGSSAVLVSVAAVVLLAGACSDGETDEPASSSSSASTAFSVPGDEPEGTRTVADVVELRPLWTSEDLRIVDDLDRDVLLRGANLNSLGEYWQGDPGHVPTIPVADTDWDEMARRGFSVIRLIVTTTKTGSVVGSWRCGPRWRSASPIIMGKRKKTLEIFGGYLDQYTLTESEVRRAHRRTTRAAAEEVRHDCPGAQGPRDDHGQGS